MAEREELVLEAWGRLAKRYPADYGAPKLQQPEWSLIAAELADMLAAERRKARGP